jgi:NADPH:quinone reductase-like Zn-dependent oxidoreductase
MKAIRIHEFGGADTLRSEEMSKPALGDDELLVLRTIAHSLGSGSLRVKLDRVFPLADARATHRHLEEEHVHGKTVLLLD